MTEADAPLGVAVIGAGAAGLTAAHRARLDVIVVHAALEASGGHADDTRERRVMRT